MSEANSIEETSRRDETGSNGRLYLWIGVVAAVASLLILPIAGLVAVYCGYKLSQVKNELYGGVIIGAGGAGVLSWVVYLLSL